MIVLGGEIEMIPQMMFTLIVWGDILFRYASVGR